jgi:hypothetical protein
MSGCSGILGKKFAIGHVGKQWNGPCVAAAQALARKEINNEISSLVTAFRPPVVQVNNELRAEGLFTGETVERTLGDVLWTASAEHKEAFAAVERFFRASLAAAKIKIRGLNGLGEIFYPFSVISDRELQVDYAGDAYRPFLATDTPGMRALLEAGGFTRCETPENLKPFPKMLAGYSVKAGAIVTDWSNANAIKHVLEWATNLPLSFFPHYRAASEVGGYFTGLYRMATVVEACGLRERKVSVFWAGLSGSGVFPRVAINDPDSGEKPGPFGEIDSQTIAAVLLTLAKEKPE